MYRLTTRRRVLITLGAAVLVGSVVTITAYAGSSSTPDGAPGQLSPSLGSVPLIQGSETQVLATLAARLPLVSNPSTVAETVPASPDSDATGTAVTGLKVLCDLTVDSTAGSDITKALWERDLFMGAVRDEFAARGFGNVIDGDATFVTPDGATQSAGGGVSIGLANDQVFGALPAGITTSIATQAASVGLQSVTVETMSLLQGVLVIHAVSNSPSVGVTALRQQGGLQFLLGQSPTNFEGVYLEIDNSEGNPVYITYTAPRDGAGGWWADPSLGIQGDLPSPPAPSGA